MLGAAVTKGDRVVLLAHDKTTIVGSGSILSSFENEENVNPDDRWDRVYRKVRPDDNVYPHLSPSTKKCDVISWDARRVRAMTEPELVTYPPSTYPFKNRDHPQQFRCGDVVRVYDGEIPREYQADIRFEGPFFRARYAESAYIADKETHLKLKYKGMVVGEGGNQFWWRVMDEKGHCDTLSYQRMELEAVAETARAMTVAWDFDEDTTPDWVKLKYAHEQLQRLLHPKKIPTKRRRSTRLAEKKKKK